MGKTATIVNAVMTPNDDPEFNSFDDARSELRESIENSRQIVRQSRMLIELSESEGAAPTDSDVPIAN